MHIPLFMEVVLLRTPVNDSSLIDVLPSGVNRGSQVRQCHLFIISEKEDCMVYL